MSFELIDFRARITSLDSRGRHTERNRFIVDCRVREAEYNAATVSVGVDRKIKS